MRENVFVRESVLPVDNSNVDVFAGRYGDRVRDGHGIFRITETRARNGDDSATVLRTGEGADSVRVERDLQKDTQLTVVVGS